MPRRAKRLRRLITLLAVALTLGVAAHGLCQAIEHHHGAKDAAALCAAALALAAGVTLLVRRRGRSLSVRVGWTTLAVLPLADLGTVDPRRSVAWLQRFQN